MKKVFMTRRVKIHTGLACNARCRFCYYWDKLELPNPPADEIKAKLRYAKKHGIKDIDFSGGEPTIRKDFPELVSYAKNLGFRQICVITNGLRMSDERYTKNLVRCGLNDSLFSIEGSSAKIHDYLTGVPGSFGKILRAIKNTKKARIRVRINTTVNSANYKDMPQLARLLLWIKPDAVNFILFNDWCSAHKRVRELACKYSEAAPYLKKSIRILRSKIKKVTVRYIPFCFMIGYEKHICNLLQKKYDPDEWVDSVKTRLLNDIHSRRASISYFANILHSLIRHPSILKFNLFELFHDAVIEKMRESYTKAKSCKKCKYNKICDGLETSYAKFIGVRELKPVFGKVIKDPLHYRRNYTLQW